MPVAEVTRSGVVESVHRRRRGGVEWRRLVAWSAGDPIIGAVPTLGVQAVAGARHARCRPRRRRSRARHRLCQPQRRAEHIAVVRGLLASVGLDESALQNTPDWPLGAGRRRATWCAPAANGTASTELQRQARRDARDVRRQWLVAGRLPRRRPSVAARIAAHVTTSPAGRARRHRRLRSTDGVRVVARRRPRLPGARDDRPPRGEGDAGASRARRWRWSRLSPS